MTDPTIVALVGNPKAGGRTTTAAVAVADALATLVDGPTVEVVELADHAAALFDWGDPTLRELVERISGAAGLVVASPTYKASFTGLLKAFLDRFGAGSLVGVTTVPLMLGGSAVHALAVEHQLRPVLVELGATMPAAGLYVVDTELSELPGVLDEWLARYGAVLAAQLRAG